MGEGEAGFVMTGGFICPPSFPTLPLPPSLPPCFFATICMCNGFISYAIIHPRSSSTKQQHTFTHAHTNTQHTHAACLLSVACTHARTLARMHATRTRSRENALTNLQHYFVSGKELSLCFASSPHTASTSTTMQNNDCKVI